MQTKCLLIDSLDTGTSTDVSGYFSIIVKSGSYDVLFSDIGYDNLGDPICDDNFHSYVLELDDATKILNNKNGDPVNFGDMSIDQFLQVREYIDLDQIDKILDMKE